MQRNKLRYVLYSALLGMLGATVIACTGHNEFNKDKWNDYSDPNFPPTDRSHMLSNLTTKHQLVGLTYYQLINFIGEPDFKEQNLIIYIIAKEYDSDIDPTYIKKLEFDYSKDSIIRSFKIIEWKK